jgi:hypothetical protein
VEETLEELMNRISMFGAAAILVTAVASPSIGQAACAMYDPGCATYPMPKKEEAARSTSVRTGVRAEVGAQQPAYRSSVRTEGVERRTTYREARNATDTGGPVRAAGAVAAGAVATAGAIATAPFRAADSYAYYNNDGYNGWDRRTYAERNGFVCTPGELFKGFDGRLHVCQ